MSGIDRSGWREFHHAKGVYEPSGDHHKQINERGNNPPEWKLLRVNTGHKPPKALVEFHKGDLQGNKYWISIKSSAVTWDPTTIKTNNISKQIVEIIDETAKILKQEKTKAFLNKAEVKGIKLQLKPHCSNSVVATSIDGRETLDYGQAVGEVKAVKESLEKISQLLTAKGQLVKNSTVESTVTKAKPTLPETRVDMHEAKKGKNKRKKSKKKREEVDQDIKQQVAKKIHQRESTTSTHRKRSFQPDNTKTKNVETSTTDLRNEREEEINNIKRKHEKMNVLKDRHFRKWHEDGLKNLKNDLVANYEAKLFELEEQLKTAQSEREGSGAKVSQLEENNERVELKNKDLEARLQQKTDQIEQMRQKQKQANKNLIKQQKERFEKQKLQSEHFKERMRELTELRGKVKNRTSELSKIKSKYTQGLEKLEKGQKKLDESRKVFENEKEKLERSRRVHENEMQKDKKKLRNVEKSLVSKFATKKQVLEEKGRRLQKGVEDIKRREEQLKKDREEHKHELNKVEDEFRKKTEELSGKLQIMEAALKFYKGLKDDYKNITTQLMNEKNEKEQLRKKGEEWQKKYDEQEQQIALLKNQIEVLIQQHGNEEDEREEQIKLLENKIEILIKQLESEKEEKVVKKESRSIQTETVPQGETKLKSEKKRKPKITHESKKDVLQEGSKIRKKNYLRAQEYEKDGDWGEALKFSKKAIAELKKAKDHGDAGELLKKCEQIRERAKKYLNIKKQIDGRHEEIEKLVGQLNKITSGKEAKKLLDNLEKKLLELDNSTLAFDKKVSKKQINEIVEKNQQIIKNVRKDIEVIQKGSERKYKEAKKMKSAITEIISYEESLKQYQKVLEQLERAPFYSKIDVEIARVKQRIEHCEEALKKNVINKQKDVKSQKTNKKFVAAKLLYDAGNDDLKKIDDSKPFDALNHCAKAKQKFLGLFKKHGRFDEGIKGLARDGLKRVKALEKEYKEHENNIVNYVQYMSQKYSKTKDLLGLGSVKEAEDEKTKTDLLESVSVKEVKDGMEFIKLAEESIPKFKERYKNKEFQKHLTEMENNIKELKDQAAKKGEALQKEAQKRKDESFKEQQDHFKPILNEELPEKNVNSWVASKQEELEKSYQYFNNLNDDFIKAELLAGTDKDNEIQKQLEKVTGAWILVNQFIKTNEELEGSREQFKEKDQTVQKWTGDLNKCKELEKKSEKANLLISEKYSSSEWLDKLYESIDEELENRRTELEARPKKLYEETQTLLKDGSEGALEKFINKGSVFLSYVNLKQEELTKIVEESVGKENIQKLKKEMAELPEKIKRERHEKFNEEVQRKEEEIKELFKSDVEGCKKKIDELTQEMKQKKIEGFDVSAFEGTIKELESLKKQADNKMAEFEKANQMLDVEFGDMNVLFQRDRFKENLKESEKKCDELSYEYAEANRKLGYIPEKLKEKWKKTRQEIDQFRQKIDDYKQLQVLYKECLDLKEQANEEFDKESQEGHRNGQQICNKITKKAQTQNKKFAYVKDAKHDLDALIKESEKRIEKSKQQMIDLKEESKTEKLYNDVFKKHEKIQKQFKDAKRPEMWEKAVKDAQRVIDGIDDKDKEHIKPLILNLQKTIDDAEKNISAEKYYQAGLRNLEKVKQLDKGEFDESIKEYQNAKKAFEKVEKNVFQTKDVQEQIQFINQQLERVKLLQKEKQINEQVQSMANKIYEREVSQSFERSIAKAEEEETQLKLFDPLFNPLKEKYNEIKRQFKLLKQRKLYEEDNKVQEFKSLCKGVVDEVKSLQIPKKRKDKITKMIKDIKLKQRNVAIPVFNFNLKLAKKNNFADRIKSTRDTLGFEEYFLVGILAMKFIELGKLKLPKIKHDSTDQEKLKILKKNKKRIISEFSKIIVKELGRRSVRCDNKVGVKITGRGVRKKTKEQLMSSKTINSSNRSLMMSDIQRKIINHKELRDIFAEMILDRMIEEAA